MRAAIYCRVSTTEQTQNLSLPTQEKACREYCARHSYDVDAGAVFVDAGESAKSTDRPEFLRLLEHCRRQRGRLHAVVVYSLTRFSRNATDHHAIAGLLRGLGITLRSVTEPIDETPTGRLMEGILAAMAQFDNDSKAERVVAGMKAAVERGRWVWQAPIGYQSADARRGPSLVPDDARAPAVREAFALCARGIKGQALLTRVTALGLRTRRGNNLTIGRLYALLHNAAYVGRIHTSAWGAEQRGDFAPLVDDELFNLVQAQLARPERAAAMKTRHANHPDFPLRRFVRCARCATSMTASWSKGKTGRRYGFYHCKRAGCQSISRATMEQAFLELLESLKPRPAYWALLKAAVLDTWRNARKEAGAAHATGRRRLADLEAKLARVEDAFLFSRTIDAATYHRKRDELREAIALAKLDLTELATEDADVEGLLAFAEHALHHASALWTGAATVEDRIRVQWAFFPTGLVWELEHFRTPSSCLDFYELAEPQTGESCLASHLYPSWKPALAWLQHLYQNLPHAA